MRTNCARNPCWGYVLMILFLCGLLMVILPPVIEVVEFQSDNAAYEAISFMPPTEPPESVPVQVTNKPQETEEPAEQSVKQVSVSDSSGNPEVSASEATEILLDNNQVQVQTETVPTAPAVTEEPYVEVSSAPVTESPATAKPAATTAPADTKTSFERLQAQNEDFIAWLSIPGTPVDYPVVQSNDSDYYLNHLFSGEKSKLGCLFSMKSANYKQPGKNIAIYGHHLSASSTMFSSLLNYKNQSYYEAHPLIKLYSLYHTSTYRIFAVLNMNISDWDPATASFSSDTDFLRFVNRAQQKAMYGTGIAVDTDDKILTLITCDRSYGGVSGRFIVMAVLEE